MPDTLEHSRNSLENHIRFQTKMSKVYIRFQPKPAQKSLGYPLGRAHTNMTYIG